MGLAVEDSGRKINEGSIKRPFATTAVAIKHRQSDLTNELSAQGPV